MIRSQYCSLIVFLSAIFLATSAFAADPPQPPPARPDAASIARLLAPGKKQSFSVSNFDTNRPGTALTKDGKNLLFGCSDGWQTSFYYMNLNNVPWTEKEWRPAMHRASLPCCSAFSPAPDGNSALVYCKRTARLYKVDLASEDATAVRTVGQEIYNINDGVIPESLSATGRYLVHNTSRTTTTPKDNEETRLVWSLEITDTRAGASGNETKTLFASDLKHSWIRFSPDERLAFVRRPNPPFADILFVKSLPEWKTLKTFEGNPRLAFSPDGSRAAICTRTCHVYSLPEFKELSSFVAASGDTDKLDQFKFGFSPDGTRLAVWDGNVPSLQFRLYDALTGKRVSEGPIGDSPAGWPYERNYASTPDGMLRFYTDNGDAVLEIPPPSERRAPTEAALADARRLLADPRLSDEEFKALSGVLLSANDEKSPTRPLLDAPIANERLKLMQGCLKTAREKPFMVGIACLDSELGDDYLATMNTALKNFNNNWETRRDTCLKLAATKPGELTYDCLDLHLLATFEKYQPWIRRDLLAEYYEKVLGAIEKAHAKSFTVNFDQVAALKRYAGAALTDDQLGWLLEKSGAKLDLRAFRLFFIPAPQAPPIDAVKAILRKGAKLSYGDRAALARSFLDLTGLPDDFNVEGAIETARKSAATALADPSLGTESALDLPNATVDYLTLILQQMRRPEGMVAKFHPTPEQGRRVLEAVLQKSGATAEDYGMGAWLIGRSGMEIDEKILGLIKIPNARKDVEQMIAVQPYQYKGAPDLAGIKLAKALLDFKDEEMACSNDPNAPGGMSDVALNKRRIEFSDTLGWLAQYGDLPTSDRSLFSRIARAVLEKFGSKICGASRTNLIRAMSSWSHGVPVVEYELVCSVRAVYQNKDLIDRPFEDVMTITHTIGALAEIPGPVSWVEGIRAFHDVGAGKDDDLFPSLLQYALGREAGVIKLRDSKVPIRVSAAGPHTGAFLDLCRARKAGASPEAIDDFLGMVKAGLDAPRPRPGGLEVDGARCTLREAFVAVGMSDDLKAVETGCASVPDKATPTPEPKPAVKAPRSTPRQPPPPPRGNDFDPRGRRHKRPTVSTD